MSFAIALLRGMLGILVILVTQFNSLVKPVIIMASVLFSTIGVFGGIATFKMDFVVVMTGIGIVSLAGVVVNNAIVLIDYIEILKRKKRKDLKLRDGEFLPVSHATACVIEGGRTRLRPVLLTTITTMAGLAPMMFGISVNFFDGGYTMNAPAAIVIERVGNARSGGFRTVMCTPAGASR